MPLTRDADYAMYLYTCNRCRSCAVEPSAEKRSICPSCDYGGFFAYSGGGKGYVAQGILEKKIKPSQEIAELAMTCLSCGACAAACPPGFDINAFIRDLRDHLVGAGFYANPEHKKLIENLRTSGNPWGKKAAASQLPKFSGGEEILVFRGCRERISKELMPAMTTILSAAGMSFGGLEDEPCCGAPFLELGAKADFERAIEKTLEMINRSGAERVLFLCPHCAAALAVDGLEIGDLEPEPVTGPQLIAELVMEERLKLRPEPDDSAPVTFHDPCRLARWLEDLESSREVIRAMGLNLVEMDRRGNWTYCCGSGAWLSQVAPGLGDFAARERIREARESKAGRLLTACSYCVGHLSRRAGKKLEVRHLAELVAARILK